MEPARRRRVEGHSALVAAQVAFGLFPFFGTLAFQPGGVSPLGLGVWRIGAGALVLGGLAVALHGRAALPRRADVPRAFACAMLGVALNQGLFLSGLSRSTPMNAGIVMCLVPVFTTGFAVLAGLERMRWARLAGLVLALAGVAPLVFPDGLGALRGDALGNALMVGNAAAFSLYVVWSKPLVSRYPPLAVTAWAYVGSLVVLPGFAWEATLLPEPGATAAWLGLAYVVLFPTILGYLANLYALARVQASTTALYILLQPLVAGLAAWAAFGERPTAAMAMAAGSLALAVLLVARRG